MTVLKYAMSQLHLQIEERRALVSSASSFSIAAVHCAYIFVKSRGHLLMVLPETVRCLGEVTMIVGASCEEILGEMFLVYDRPIAWQSA